LFALTHLVEELARFLPRAVAAEILTAATRLNTAPALPAGLAAILTAWLATILTTGFVALLPVSLAASRIAQL
jgi:hypothetical protein